MRRTEFDAEYYERFYLDPERCVGDEVDTARLVRFVSSYLGHLKIRVENILDLGCGLGWWKKPCAVEFPRASFKGVERSEHLCAELGWARGSVVDWRDSPHDLVICQGVLQYLSDKDARRAIANLGRLTGKALYLEAVTAEDWQHAVDRRRSDKQIELRPTEFYRAALSRRFIAVGGGLYIAKSTRLRLFALERSS